jgi:hypothetical protein
MITVSEQAVTELQALLRSIRAPRGHGVKLIPDRKGGISITIDAPGAGDTVIQRDEAPLLIVDGSLVGPLDGLVLDSQIIEVDGRMSTEFTFRRLDGAI